jgi:CBS domain-containing protein
MSRFKVSDVMTTQVWSVRQDASLRVIADVLTSRSISAVPVVDGESRVLGVVSEADLLARIDDAGEDSATNASDLMTTPVVTIEAEAPVTDAAKLLSSAGVKRLPVVDAGGRLVGIVSRHDLVKVFLR